MKIKQARIDRIKLKIAQISEMRPGSLSKQYNVCGNPTCRCKDPKKPRKHGPYYQLSYTRNGKSRTEFVRREDLAHVRTQIKNYAAFKKLTDQWIDLSIQLSQLRKKAPKK